MRPSGSLLLLIGVLFAFAVGAVFSDGLTTILGILAILVAIVAVVDAVNGRRLETPEVERDAPAAFALGVWSNIALTFRGRHSGSMDVVDFVPDGFEYRHLPRTMDLVARRAVQIEYRVRPSKRGDHVFSGVRVRLYSPYGLWTFRRFIPLRHEVRVYPNFAAVMKYSLPEVQEHLSLAGLRQSRRRGEGLEFHQLREYRIGDTFRQVDWKASARFNKLISKDYEDEHDQQVVFLLDTGRRMLAQEDEYSHFDHALNAMLLLAYVAVNRGDAVGCLTFGGEDQWMKPQKGAGAITQLLNAVYRLEPEPVATDYQAAVTELMIRQRRRALIVVLTNVRDEDADDLTVSLRMLQRRHLVLLASLRESELDATLRKTVSGFEQALRFAATAQYLDERRKAHEALHMPGVLLQDVTCEELPAAITGSYLRIKRAGRL